MNKYKTKFLLGASALIGTIGITALSAKCGGNEQEEPKPDKPVNPGSGDDEIVVAKPEYTIYANNNPEWQKRRTTSSQDKVAIGVTFSTSGKQYEILSNLIDLYNEEAKDQTGFQQVILKSMGSGYGEGFNKVSTELQSGGSVGFSLVLNYPGVASKLAENNMILNFRSEKPEYDVNIDLFNKKFIKSNSNTENISNTDGTWILPMMKSTNVMAIDGPVMYYILSTYVKNGAKWDETDTKMQALYDEVVKAAKVNSDTGEFLQASDVPYIMETWGEPRENVRELIGDFKLSSSIFESYKDLMDFSRKTQSMFKNLKQEGSTDIRVFGIDDPAGFFNSALYSAVDGDDTKMLSFTTEKDGQKVVDYKNLASTSSQTYIKSKEIFDKVLETIQTGAMKLNGSGVYSSTSQVVHKYAFSIGSTAGYTHNFIKNSTEKFTLNFNGQELSPRLDYDSYKFFGLGAEKLESLKDYTKLSDDLKVHVAGYSKSKYANLVFKSTITDKEISDAGIKYYTRLQTPEEDVLYAKQTTEAGENGLFGLEFKVTNKDQVKPLADELASKDASKVSVLSCGGRNGQSVFISYLGYDNSLDKSKNLEALANILGAKYEFVPTTKTLNEDELISIPTPGKWEKDSTTTVVYVQGPSLIGISNNEANDNATRKFVKWLATSNTPVVINQSKKNEMTFNSPRHAFQYVASYIFPVQGFQDSENAKEQVGDNAYLQVAYNKFSELAKSSDENFKAYEEPGSASADDFRSKITSAFTTLQVQVESDGARDVDFSKAFVEAFSNYIK